MEDDWGHTFIWMAAGEEYTAGDRWGAGAEDALGACTGVLEGPGYHRWELGSFANYGPTDEYQAWTVTFNLCLEDAGD